VNVDEVSQTDFARSAARTPAVEVDKYIFGASDVEVVVNTASKPHSTIHG